MNRDADLIGGRKFLTFLYKLKQVIENPVIYLQTIEILPVGFELRQVNLETPCFDFAVFGENISAEAGVYCKQHGQE